MALLAERVQISRTTLTKVEQGDPAVSLGIYAAVLFSLGLIDRLATLADPGLDAVGLQLEQEQLPQRIVLRRTARAVHPFAGPSPMARLRSDKFRLLL